MIATSVLAVDAVPETRTQRLIASAARLLTVYVAGTVLIFVPILLIAAIGGIIGVEEGSQLLDVGRGAIIGLMMPYMIPAVWVPLTVLWAVAVRLAWSRRASTIAIGVVGALSALLTFVSPHVALVHSPLSSTTTVQEGTTCVYDATYMNWGAWAVAEYAHNPTCCMKVEHAAGPRPHC